MERDAPLSNGDDAHEVARVLVLLTREVRLLVGELVDLRLEVDVGGVDAHVRVELAGREPVSSEVTRQVTRWLDEARPVHHCDHPTATPMVIATHLLAI